MDNNNNNYFQGQTPPPQGAPQGPGQANGYPPQGAVQTPAYPPQYSAPPAQGQYAEVPQAVKKWNWGAMMFSLFWGIGNHAYLSLLILVPCLNFVWMFVCGAMGNQWAWKSGEFKDVEQFMAVQRTWNKAGFVAFILWIAATIFYFILVIAFFDTLIPVLDSSGFDIY